MGYVVKVPKLGLEMDAGTVVEWFLEEGESVEAEEPIGEIESEKTTAEIDAREDGVLRRIVLAEGESAPPGAPMAVVAAADADIADLLAEAGVSESDDSGSTEEAATTSDATEPKALAGSAASGAEPGSSDEGGTATGSPGGGKVSPRARKRAEELGVDPATVSGSGPDGAVTEDDVERAAEAGGETADAPGSDEEPEKVSPRARKRANELDVDLSTLTGTGPGGAVTAEDVEAAAERAEEETQEDVSSDVEAGDEDADGRTVLEERPLDGMRRTISARLGESYRNAVHVTEHRTAEAGSLRRAAKAATAVCGTDVSVTDVLLAAISASLEEHPAFNATFEDGVHRLYADRNVALAVDVEDGLITPVVENVEERSIAELADERRRMTDRALSGSFTMDDLSGGTFTVSNLGLLGVESFDPIINPPQVAILGVNALSERPVVRDGEVVVRQVLPLDLSFDHRIVDGADAARFLGTLVDHLENPWPLLSDVSPSDAPDAAATDEEDHELALPERTATARLDPDLSGTVTAGDSEWPYDVTPEFGGGRHPTPVDYFTGALAGCLSASIGVQADMREIAFEGIEVTAESAPPEGSVESIDLEVALSGVDDADDDALDRIVSGGERTCHVAELLREDLEVNVSWRRAD